HSRRAIHWVSAPIALSRSKMPSRCRNLCVDDDKDTSRSPRLLRAEKLKQPSNLFFAFVLCRRGFRAAQDIARSVKIQKFFECESEMFNLEKLQRVLNFCKICRADSKMTQQDTKQNH